MPQSIVDSPLPTKKPTPRKAEAPFNREDADFIIRTSDKVDFYVHRLIISLGSGLFEGMLALPQPQGTDLKQPFVDVVEDSNTMDAFLRFLYPVQDPAISTFKLLRSVIEAGRKYDAPQILAEMQKVLAHKQFFSGDPVRVFAIACLFNMEELAQDAAIEAVVTGRVLIGHKCEDLDDIPAASYHRLLQLNKRPVSKVKGKAATVDPSKIGPFCGRAVLPHPPPIFTTRRPPQEVASEFALAPASHPPDLVLKTNDDHSFLVHEVIIRFASPSLLSNLSPVDTVGQSSNDIPDTPKIPTYIIPEPADVTRVLLKWCYPSSPSPPAITGKRYLDILRATRKYSFYKAEADLRSTWDRYMISAPLEFFFAAAQWGWQEEAQACARELIDTKDDLADIEKLYTSEMETITADVYRSLLSYVDRCSAAASARMKTGQIPTLPLPPASVRNSALFTGDRQVLPLSTHCDFSLEKPVLYLEELLHAVRRKPSTLMVIDMARGRPVQTGPAGAKFLVALCRASTGSDTTERVMEWGMKFLEGYGNRLKDALSEVTLELPPARCAAS
ncbi:uncharacterized protein BXZ73DRAFT_108336 [Epithele typhae]|uniref:uncharacterized protein n=1 Tax=Epithele typhae TaxID=378194 RepID=UPI0020073FF7|nr:uncharacterized protein BXZ73DRAFT_108336 [Epithele typhae]KAH9910973.1 hypothetical protein BXZ73DRAFT_108336 [Epithele typhae]